jgi:hypothetical protein
MVTTTDHLHFGHFAGPL